MECSPGGSFLISRTILTPDGAGESVAVPTAWPSAFTMLTTTGLAEAEDCWAIAAPESENSTAAQARIFMGVLSDQRIDGLRGNLKTSSPTVPQSPWGGCEFVDGAAYARCAMPSS